MNPLQQLMSLFQGQQGPEVFGPPMPPQPAIPPWINLRAQRPPQVPLLSLDVPGAMQSGMTGLNRALTPGAPFRSMIDPNSSNAMQALATAGDAVVNLPHNIAQLGVTAGNALVKPAAATVMDQFVPQDRRQAALPVPSAPSAPLGGIKFGLPSMAESAGPRTTTIGPQPSANPLQRAMSLIREKEGFREGTYWDVNAHRVGYGTDTITGPDGTVRAVKAGDKVSRADAERDLERRTGEFMGSVRTSVGEDAFKKLNENQIAALTSVTYNYGSLPKGVAEAAKTGDPEKIAQSIEALQGHNDGVNKARRLSEAALARGQAGAGSGMAMPGAPNIEAPQLPLPGATIPRQGLDPAAYDRFNALSVERPPPMETSDKITTLLAAMAQGAGGANNLGDLLLGAGGGAAAGAAKNIASGRKEDADFKERQFGLQKLLAGVDVQKASAAQEGANFKIAAQNTDSQLLTQVKTEQAKLDAAAKNKVAELENEVDWKKWQAFQPQIKADKDGVTIIERNEQGGIKVTQQKGNEMDALADQIKDAAAVYGKDSATLDVMRYGALAKRGEPFVRRQIMKDMVDKNMVRGVLGEDAFKKLDKEAEKGLDLALRAKPEEWDSQKKQRMLDLLWGQKFPDNVWLVPMLKQGNVGAAMLAQPNG